MLCQECHAKPATVHITKIINNKKTQLSLCEECAGVYQQQWSEAFEPTFSINKFLAGLLNYDTSAEKAITGTRNACPQCGQTYNHFAQSGKLGCDGCYETFQDNLTPLLRRVHGSQIHKGKVPRRTGGSIRLRKELQDLKFRLQELIKKEEFEEAAQVRDKIRNLEKQVGNS